MIGISKFDFFEKVRWLIFDVVVSRGNLVDDCVKIDRCKVMLFVDCLFIEREAVVIILNDLVVTEAMELLYLPVIRVIACSYINS